MRHADLSGQVAVVTGAPLFIDGGMLRYPGFRVAS